VENKIESGISDEEKERQILSDIHNKKFTKEELALKGIELMKLEDLKFSWNLTKTFLTLGIGKKRIQDCKQHLGITDEERKVFELPLIIVEEPKKAEPIYEEDILMEGMQENSMLKTVFKINNRFINSQEEVSKLNLDYEESKKTIDIFFKANPRYGDSQLGIAVKGFLYNLKQKNVLKNQQIEILKKVIQDMIKISK